MSNYNCLTMMILRKCRANYEELTSLINTQSKLRSYVGRDEQIKRINDLQDYITQQTAYLTEFDETLVQCWIKQITIWENRITVELKSGVSIDVDA